MGGAVGFALHLMGLFLPGVFQVGSELERVARCTLCGACCSRQGQWPPPPVQHSPGQPRAAWGVLLDWGGAADARSLFK